MLLTVDINIFWRLAKWQFGGVHLTEWQRATILPALGVWHPLKVLWDFLYC